MIEESLPILKEANEPTQQAVCYHLLGKIALQEGKWEESENLYQQSLALHRQYGCKPACAIALTGLGQVADTIDQEQLARQYFSQTLELASQMNADPLLGETLLAMVPYLKRIGADRLATSIVRSIEQSETCDYATKINASTFRGHATPEADLIPTSLQEYAEQARHLLSDIALH